ncbi:protocatechuate 3,4-dioxygenase subunit alpha [uncultured Jannaschia sp.]|uniref:protocatechuate 3,4-dioxygenase subunit alpha n=1 Tax=uncultured Jannaschia sp. TaxID=293347 RepID=UPI00261F2F0D|nr:protocatechuate 3,4-dioxygenase subunit alpha [uncultured Jannaschia sp.]
MRESASQTAGPYVHIGLLPNAAGIGMYGGADLGAEMITGAAEGERIEVAITILDGADEPLADALVEIWQADAAGHLPSRDPHLAGWARRACDDAGTVHLSTVRPGAIGPHAPHLTLWIMARGINLGLHTRLYFDGDPANATDPLLAAIDPPDRAATLLAHAADGAWHMTIRLQGDAETVFLDM